MTLKGIFRVGRGAVEKRHKCMPKTEGKRKSRAQQGASSSASKQQPRGRPEEKRVEALALNAHTAKLCRRFSIARPELFPRNGKRNATSPGSDRYRWNKIHSNAAERLTASDMIDGRILSCEDGAQSIINGRIYEK